MKDIKVSELINFAERFNLLSCSVENVLLAYRVWWAAKQSSARTDDDIVAAMYGGNAIEGPLKDCYDSKHNKSFTGYAVHLINGDTRSDDYTDDVIILLTEEEYRENLIGIYKVVDMLMSHIMDAE